MKHYRPNREEDRQGPWADRASIPGCVGSQVSTEETNSKQTTMRDCNKGYVSVMCCCLTNTPRHMA